MRGATEKFDKYEQLLTKYDWHASRPPRGYVYGIGRGAKAFITTAELSVGTAAAPKPTLEEDAFFSALDRVERRKDADSAAKHTSCSTTSVAAQGTDPSGAVRLTLADLAGIESVEVVGASLLTVRKARTETAEQAEEYLFADERVLTANDVLRGKTSATQQGLHNALQIGSLDEQTTWITHSRAYREMGMAGKAQQTLTEGCARTGTKGAMIWEERLQYIPESNPVARRKVLEEAAAACPGAETLWLQLLTYQPPHAQIEWLQRAVTACPTSEALWLRVLLCAPAASDQRRIIRRALQQTLDLPLLWARLARLEEGYEEGKQVFREAARRCASLALLLEAVKYVEWWHVVRPQAMLPWRSLESVGAAVRGAEPDMEPQVEATRRSYLEITTEASRRRWLDKAEAVAHEDGYVWTAAHMLAAFATPTGLGERGASTTTAAATTPSSAGPVLASTWLEDLMSLIPGVWRSSAVLCALWGAWLLLQLPGNGSPSLAFGYGADDRQQRLLDVLSAAIELTPEEDLLSAEELLTTARVKNAVEVEDDEQEELGRPVATSASPQQSSSSQPVPAHPNQQVRTLSPLSVVLARSLATPAFMHSGGAAVAVTIAEAFYTRARYHASLAILERTAAAVAASAASVPAASTVGVIFPIATATTYAKLGQLDRADGCLYTAATARPETATHGDDSVFIKLVIHRRSRHEDVTALLQEGTRRFPRSRRLWLMQLDVARAAVAKTMVASQHRSPQGGVGAPADVHASIRELRLLYEQALSEAHCRSCVDVWVYAAVRIESELLSSAATAGALLLDAAVALGTLATSGTGSQSYTRTAATTAGGGTAASSSSSASQGGQQQQLQCAVAAAAIGLARAKVELRHAGAEPALEVITETLHRLPKSREGVFTVPVGELLGLFIDLSPPAARGRAAAMVMKQWRSREPLAVAAVAKFYHVAGLYDRALTEAMKAAATAGVPIATTTATAGGGSGGAAGFQKRRGRRRYCGDAVALLLKLAQLPEYKKTVADKLGLSEEEEAKLTTLPVEAVRTWVLGTAALRPDAHADMVADPRVTAEVPHTVDGAVVPNSGPLWIQVSKASDPTNVTLTGFRDSVEVMLSRVADLIVLKK